MCVSKNKKLSPTYFLRSAAKLVTTVCGGGWVVAGPVS